VSTVFSAFKSLDIPFEISPCRRFAGSVQNGQIVRKRRLLFREARLCCFPRRPLFRLCTFLFKLVRFLNEKAIQIGEICNINFRGLLTQLSETSTVAAKIFHPAPNFASS
jgi:hypothetical protein